MQELERMINVYHTAYIVFLVLTIVLFCLTFFMFFKFDIRKIVDMKTGRGKKKSIQRMEEINAQTGKLRQEVADTPSRLKPEERITYPVTEQHLNVQVSTQDNRVRDLDGGVRLAQNASVMMEQVASQQTDYEGAQETTLLNDSSETTLLYQEDPATTVLSGNPMTAGTVNKNLPGYFHIEKEILWVHTKEVL